MKYFIICIFALFLGCVQANHLAANHYKKHTSIQKSSDKQIYGVLIYNIPDTMVLDRSYNIKIKIKTVDQIPVIPALDITKVKTIYITSAMYVSIQDPMPDDFKIFQIESVNNNIQEVKDNFTEWNYKICPIKNGTYILDVVVSLIHDNVRKDETYKNYVIVKNNEIVKVDSFWKKNWAWLIATILIPFSTFLWKIRSNKNK